jgi:hypothetical protein
LRYPLKDLVSEYVQGRNTGLRVGRDMRDVDHPQNWLGKLKIGLPDPQILRDPRPDLSQDESRRMSSWDPVGVGNTKITSGTSSVTVQ